MTSEDLKSHTGHKSFIVSLLLSLFLGSLGFDRFYLGYKMKGALKLITLGGLGLWYLYDIIQLLRGKLTDNHGHALDKRKEYFKPGLITSIVVLAIVFIFFGSAIVSGISQTGNPGPARIVSRPSAVHVISVHKSIAPKSITDQLQGAVSNANLSVLDDHSLQFNNGNANLSFVNENFLDDKSLVEDGFNGFIHFGIQAFKIPGVQTITVQEEATSTDSYGNNTESSAIRISMDKSNFSKFNWNNLQGVTVYDQIVSSANDYYINPSLIGSFTPEQINYF